MAIIQDIYLVAGAAQFWRTSGNVGILVNIESCLTVSDALENQMGSRSGDDWWVLPNS